MAEKIIIYGIHPVQELVNRNPKKILKVYIKEGLQARELPEIISVLQKNKVVFSYVNEQKLTAEAGRGANHQGIVAEVKDIETTSLDTLLKNLDMSKNPAIVLIDEITDLHNMGAIIRSATAFGMSGIIIPKHNQAPLNGVVYKTSAGTLGILPIVKVTNINQTIDTLKENGFWIYGLSEKAETPLAEIKFDSPVCFIIGNEDYGIREMTLKRCDVLVKIPISEKVDSLNASVAGAVLMSVWAQGSV